MDSTNSIVIPDDLGGLTASEAAELNGGEPESLATDEAAEPYDPMDLANLRVSSYDDPAVESVQITVTARRPGTKSYFRVRPPWRTDPLDVYTYEHGEDMDAETYLVTAGIAPLISQLAPGQVRPTRLYQCMTVTSVLFLWPVALPMEGANEASRRWARSRLTVADEAQHQWIRMWGDKVSQGYQIKRAKGDLGTPSWPDKTTYDLMKQAFREKFIDKPDHDVIKQLEGEIG